MKNPSYRTKNGDAAFHEPGTEIYSIKNHDEFIAVKSQNSINGYQVYYLNESSQYKWHFKDMPLNEVSKIEIYLDTHLITELNNEEIEKFLDLLSNGVLETSFQPDTNQRDPIYYEMVFYTEKPIAYNYTLFFDGKTYYWYPWDTVVLSEKIGEFLK